jgi:hypothetical protein
MENGNPTELEPKPETKLDDLPVDTLIKEVGISKGDNGKYIIPDDLKDKIHPYKLEAVKAELRRRDTEASYTKANQELIKLEAEAEALRKFIPSTPNLSKEEQERLEALKYEDPDAWLEEMIKIKQDSKKKLDEEIANTISEISSSKISKSDEEKRSKLLKQFNEKVEKPLTSDNLKLDVPLRFQKDLEDGKITFEEFLDSAYKFINGSKAIADVKINEEPTFEGTSGGGKIIGSGKEEDDDPIY